jgi:hypothetical protein
VKASVGIKRHYVNLQSRFSKYFPEAVYDKYCEVLPVNASNNLLVADFISQFIGCTRRITMACDTFNLISHKPVTSSGVNYS